MENQPGYWGKIQLIQGNARLYMLGIVISGLGLGVQRLLFNFYVLSLGYSETFLGTLISTNSLVAILGALPAGYVSDMLGRKRSFLISAAVSGLAMLGLLQWHQPAGLILMNVVLGLANSLLWVSGPPFMMENSNTEERSYLFSFSSGLQTVAGFLGNLFGGFLPGWLAARGDFHPESTQAYSGALLFVTLCYFLTLLAFAPIKDRPVQQQSRSILAPFQFAWRRLPLLGKLLGPGFIIALGAGLLIPFRNIFYRNVYARTDAEVGQLFALGSLAMAAGFLLAPILADRLGKIRLVVLSQFLSIPFLLLMGFSPYYWLSAAAFLARGALMNMSNPIYQAFLMEHVEEDSRAMVTSLNSMSWNFGWTVSPQISGWIQESYGFGPVFAGTTSTYVIGTLLTHWFFGRKKAESETRKTAGTAL
ncbi:MAG: MFS transporter [Chloroflexia bacterium]|nr:MFS transporter [Chloroflexia bacterium]